MEVIPVPNGDPQVGPGQDDRLPCGMQLDQLLTQVAERTAPRNPEHQRHCPFCHTALAELRDLWAPVLELADENVQAPSGLLDAVLARIRELSHDPWHITVTGPDGNVRVAARVLSAIARVAAREVPGVGLALGRAQEPQPSVDADGRPAVLIAVDVAVDYGAPIHLVANAVRRRIATDLPRHTGVAVAAVDVTIVDVRPPPPR
jgi:uncharacterized alkaline shock family protein YloU